MGWISGFTSRVLLAVCAFARDWHALIYFFLVFFFLCERSLVLHDIGSWFLAYSKLQKRNAAALRYVICHQDKRASSSALTAFWLSKETKGKWGSGRKASPPPTLCTWSWRILSVHDKKLQGDSLLKLFFFEMSNRPDHTSPLGVVVGRLYLS